MIGRLADTRGPAALAAVWSCGVVPCLRTALDSRRWLDDRHDLKDAQQNFTAWLKRWAQRSPRLTDWGEAHSGETLTCYRLPRQHRMHLQSTTPSTSWCGSHVEGSTPRKRL